MSANNDVEFLNECYNLIKKIIKESDEIVKEGFSNISNTEIKTKKGNWDLFTEYDGRVENFIISNIMEKFPNHKFIGEETVAKTDKTPELTDDPTWIIDPIDGTTNFVHGLPIACISVALVYKKTIEIGIISNPMQNELYCARRNEGAFLNNIPLQTSTVKTIDESLIGHEISLARIEAVRDKNIKRLVAFVSVAHGIRCLGSAALALCYVAKGSIDGYHIDDLKPWDIAAGALIIQEAGGYFKKPNGTTFDVMKPDIVCAGTIELCNAMVEIIKNCQ